MSRKLSTEFLVIEGQGPCYSCCFDFQTQNRGNMTEFLDFQNKRNLAILKIEYCVCMNCIYNVIFVKMKSPNNMLNSVVLFLFGGINKYLAVYFANLYKLKFLFFEKSC